MLVNKFQNVLNFQLFDLDFAKLCVKTIIICPYIGLDEGSNILNVLLNSRLGVDFTITVLQQTLKGTNPREDKSWRGQTLERTHPRIRQTLEGDKP